MPGIQIVQFATFSFIFAVISAVMVRGANYLYGKIGVCHRRMPDKTEDPVPGQDYEKMYTKLGKLWRYNFITAFTIVALITLYSFTPFASAIGFDTATLTALVTVAIILNFAIRVGGLAGVETEFATDARSRAQAFGFGFILSIYALLLFGASVYVIKEGFPRSVSGGLTGSGSEISVLLLLVIFGPLLSAFASEYLLHPNRLGTNHYTPLESDEESEHIDDGRTARGNDGVGGDGPDEGNDGQPRGSTDEDIRPDNPDNIASWSSSDSDP
jgi:hypothetical protein